MIERHAAVSAGLAGVLMDSYSVHNPCLLDWPLAACITVSDQDSIVSEATFH